MTVQEIHKEVFEDIFNLKDKVDKCFIDFNELVLKESCFPFTKSYDCKTREKGNLFIVDFTALNKSDYGRPILSVYGIYTRSEGKYAVAITLELNTISIYPPHFFKRYWERIVKDKSISNEDIIRLYFKNDWGVTGSVVNKDFESVYHCFENDNPDEKLSFVTATSQGYCFGEKQGRVNIIKTIISDEMLFEDQKFIFNELRKILRGLTKVKYGANI